MIGLFCDRTTCEEYSECLVAEEGPCERVRLGKKYPALKGKGVRETTVSLRLRVTGVVPLISLRFEAPSSTASSTGRCVVYHMVHGLIAT